MVKFKSFQDHGSGIHEQQIMCTQQLTEFLNKVWQTLRLHKSFAFHHIFILISEGNFKVLMDRKQVNGRASFFFAAVLVCGSRNRPTRRQSTIVSVLLPSYSSLAISLTQHRLAVTRVPVKLLCYGYEAAPPQSLGKRKTKELLIP